MSTVISVENVSKRYRLGLIGSRTLSADYQRGDLKTQVPRHSEIVDELARKICKDLDIPFVR